MKCKITAMLTCMCLLTALAGCGTPTVPVSTPEGIVETSAEMPISKPEDSAEEAAANDSISTTTEEPEVLSYDQVLFGADVLNVDFTIPEEDWAYLMENATEKPWISGDVTIDGETFENVGIKTKGNTSLSTVAMSGSDRFSLKVNFGKYKEDQTCFGLDKLALNNIFADNTYLKEYMSYHLFHYMGVPAPLCTYAKITVNGDFYGLYLAVEDTDSSFLDRNYGADTKVEAYKPENLEFDGMPQFPRGDNDSEEAGHGFPGGFPPPGELPDFEGGFPPLPGDFPLPENFSPPGGFIGFGGMDSGVSLKYVDDDPESYQSIFDNNITKIKEKDQIRLIASLKGISESEGSDLEQYINVDEILRYTACNVFLVNMDSYFSHMGHNYVLAEEQGILSMIPWDYNLSFGTHEISSASEAINYAIDTVFSGTTAEERPIVGKPLADDTYLERYHDYLREIAEDYIGSGLFSETLQEKYELLDPYVQEDATSFGGYDAFPTGVYSLYLFGTLRAESILGQLEGTIPAKAEERTDFTSLVDASYLDMSNLGTMGRGRLGRN